MGFTPYSACSSMRTKNGLIKTSHFLCNLTTKSSLPGFSQYGRGDVVFSDPARNRLLEDYLDHNTSGRSRKTKRTKKILKVNEQALECVEEVAS
jgi:hypothetical protein